MSEVHDHRDEHSDDIVAAPGVEQVALAVINAYQDAWNLRDVAGTDATLHFPHVRIASGTVTVFDGPGFMPPDFFERFVEQTGWNHSLWDYRRAIQSGPDKVHFAVQFTRYRADGTTIGAFPSVWIVTRRGERWGIEARSSFAP